MGYNEKLKPGCVDKVSVTRVVGEQTAVATYDKETKENAIEKTTQNQDGKYKTKEAGGLDKKAAELTTDIEGVKSELAQALSMLESHCRRGELLTRRLVIGESTAKKEEADGLFEKSTTKFNKASPRSKQLKEEVATLQKELAELASTQSEMDKIRADEEAVYEKNKPEMEQSLKGVKLALKILNDCYAKALLTVHAVASSACLSWGDRVRFHKG